MPEGRAMTSRRGQLAMAVLALAAACAVIASPWTKIAPLSSGLSVWMESVLPNWAQGTVMISFRETATSVASLGLAGRLIPLSILYALPFLTLPKDVAGRDGATAGRLVGIMMLGVAVPDLVHGAAGAMGDLGAGHVLVLAGSAFAGSLLLLVGVHVFLNGRQTISLCQQTLGLLAGMSGVCFASILLLPIGIILLIPTYLVLVMCQLARP